MIAIQPARYHLTNKTGTVLNVFDIGIQIEGSAVIHRSFSLFRVNRAQ
jgi:hypothetical protein